MCMYDRLVSSDRALFVGNKQFAVRGKSIIIFLHTYRVDNECCHRCVCVTGLLTPLISCDLFATRPKPLAYHSSVSVQICVLFDIVLRLFTNAFASLKNKHHHVLYFFLFCNSTFRSALCAVHEGTTREEKTVVV